MTPVLSRGISCRVAALLTTALLLLVYCKRSDGFTSVRRRLAIPTPTTPVVMYCPEEEQTLSAGTVTWPRTRQLLTAVVSCPAIPAPNNTAPSPALYATRHCIVGSAGQAAWGPGITAPCPVVQYCPPETENVTGKGLIAWPRTAQRLTATAGCPGTDSSGDTSSGGASGSAASGSGSGSGSNRISFQSAFRACLLNASLHAVWGASVTSNCPLESQFCDAVDEVIPDVGTVTWPRTRLFSAAVISCPTASSVLAGVQLKASRACVSDLGGLAVWSPGDTTACGNNSVNQYCASEQEHTIRKGVFQWPRTKVLAFASVVCPSASAGASSPLVYATRQCAVSRAGEPQWLSSVSSACLFLPSAIARLADIKAAALSSDLSAVEVVQLLASLARITATLGNDSSVEATLEIVQQTTTRAGVLVVDEKSREITDLVAQIASDVITYETAAVGMAAGDGHRGFVYAQLTHLLDNLLAVIDVSGGSPYFTSTAKIGIGLVCPSLNGSGMSMLVREGANDTLAIEVATASVNVLVPTMGGVLAQSLLSAEAYQGLPAENSSCQLPVVQFIVVRRQDSLFAEVEDVTVADSRTLTRSSTAVHSAVVSAEVRNRRPVSMRGLVRLRFNTSLDSVNSTSHCVFWNITSRTWSSEGCTASAVADATNLVECHCNHLTSFAAILTPAEEIRHARALSIVTTVGSVVSIVCLLLTIISIMLVKKQRRASHMKLTVVQASVMAVFLLLFVTASSVSNYAACVFVAMALHFLLLVQFTCSFAQALVLVQRLIMVFETTASMRIRKLSRVAVLVVPAIAVAIAAGTSELSVYASHNIQIDGGETQHLCWLNKTGMQYALYPLIGAVVLFNFAVLLAVSIRIGKRRRAGHNKSGSDAAKLSNYMYFLRLVVVLGSMLGVSWVVGGILIASGYALALQIIFALLVPLQGLFLFVFVCLSNNDIRAKWRTVLRRLCCWGWHVHRALSFVKSASIRPRGGEYVVTDFDGGDGLAAASTSYGSAIIVGSGERPTWAYSSTYQDQLERDIRSEVGPAATAAAASLRRHSQRSQPPIVMRNLFFTQTLSSSSFHGSQESLANST